jgi:hypothetical protein
MSQIKKSSRFGPLKAATTPPGSKYRRPRLRHRYPESAPWEKRSPEPSRSTNWHVSKSTSRASSDCFAKHPSSPRVLQFSSSWTNFYFVRKAVQPEFIDFFHRLTKDTPLFLKVATIKPSRMLKKGSAESTLYRKVIRLSACNPMKQQEVAKFTGLGGLAIVPDESGSNSEGDYCASRVPGKSDGVILGLENLDVVDLAEKMTGKRTIAERIKNHFRLQRIRAYGGTGAGRRSLLPGL